MSETIERVVFDCNVFAQALITPGGKSGRCVELVLDGRVQLFRSDVVLGEIRRIPEKPTPKKLGVTPDIVNALVARLLPVAHWVDTPPAIYRHPYDPKDSHYVDLAVATASSTIISSDKHLLNLMDPVRPDGADFLTLFPTVKVLQPWRWIDLLGSRGILP